MDRRDARAELQADIDSRRTEIEELTAKNGERPRRIHLERGNDGLFSISINERMIADLKKEIAVLKGCLAFFYPTPTEALG